jgi:predicted nucleotidyltransferase
VLEAADTSLSADERLLLERFVSALRADPEIELHAVWLFGSRARGEAPAGEGSDVDLLILVHDASWDGKGRVHDALADAVADAPLLQSVRWSLSLHIQTPQWLAQRREIRSFFIAEVDRDKVVLAGSP